MTPLYLCPILHRVKTFFRFIFLILLLIWPLPAVNAEEPSIALSLSEAIRLAIQNNPDIKIERENIDLQEANTLSERALFDPSFRLNTKHSVYTSPSFFSTQSLLGGFDEQRGTEISLGWKKPLSWGGETEIVISQLKSDSGFQSLNPTYQADMTLRWTQPLLKGFGKDIKQSSLVIAQRQVKIAHQAFRARVADILLKVISLYWELIFQRENLLVQQDSLKLAQHLLEINETKVKLGLMASIEILVAESLVASREEAVIIAQKGILDTQDQLGVLIGQWESGLPFSGKIIPSDRPVAEAADLDPKQLLSLAYQERSEMLAKTLEIENDHTRVSVAQNRLRTALDFIVALGPTTGVGTKFSDSFDQFISGDAYHWEAGLLWTVPIGNWLAIAAVQKESASQRKSKIETERLKLKIQLDVREGERRVATDFERIKATRHALALSKKQLSAATERFHLGLLSSRDFITFQNDVTIAAGHALRAVIDYNKSLGNLERVTGMLLKKYQIEMGLP